ncbi:hypothetical protein BpHYR1_002638 [Brachionus plicatilis]|uniref:Uncharacterized protein n=1 Tax=Brachionus plicatilis TaxID=10195 RepID=A0A3M7QQN7_BRAPC|nr:hypothetical protein BpHYR1_002638 [Brachionus plicatilis]
MLSVGGDSNKRKRISKNDRVKAKLKIIKRIKQDEEINLHLRYLEQNRNESDESDSEGEDCNISSDEEET